MSSATSLRRPSTELSEPPSARIALAKERFLSNDAVPNGAVRQPILASWTRARQSEVPSDHLELSYESQSFRESPLLHVVRPILDEVADQMATEPMSVILCDDEGVVLDRRTGDSGLEQHLNRVWLAPGFSYAEEYVGTNGIGTALECRGPAHVFGHEHYVQHLEELACAGAPIRHPITGRLVGVLDLTCWRRDAGPLLITTAAVIASRIQEGLLESAGRHEVALLHEYLTACRRSRGVVMAVADDLVMMNDRARELLDPADQGPLITAGTEALGTGQRCQLVLDLPSGATARLQCRPSWPESREGGGVLLVELLDGERHHLRGGSGSGLPTTPLPAAVGSGALWATCCQTVDRHFGAREWLVLSGEAGTGKRTLARATHQRRTPAAHLRVLDAATFGPSWLADVADELTHGAGTLVLAHVDRLGADDARALAEVLEPYRESTDPDRPWVVATMGPGRPGHSLSRVVDCFPRTVDVPPLRHHIEDVAELVRHFIARHTHGADLTCSAEAMRVLMRNRWPGNVEQLQQVLRKIVTRQRTGVIEVRDLPPEVFATVRRVLTPLEAIECDAIVNALLETGGSKAEAASRLGMSRATIYRKLRGYGISMPK
jgi:transcriptional regulator of acetoin/glycerol metabolism